MSLAVLLRIIVHIVNQFLICLYLLYKVIIVFALIKKHISDLLLILRCIVLPEVIVLQSLINSLIHSLIVCFRRNIGCLGSCRCTCKCSISTICPCGIIFILIEYSYAAADDNTCKYYYGNNHPGIYPKPSHIICSPAAYFRSSCPVLICMSARAAISVIMPVSFHICFSA